MKTQNMKNVIPYVSTHNPQNPEIYNVIRNNLPILEEDPDMKKILDNSQVIKSKRQSPNFKKILTRAFFPVKLEKFLLSRDATNLDAVHVLTSQKDPIFILKTGANLQLKRLCHVQVLT